MRVVIVTIGSLGDVRPYVALGQAFLGAGHAVTLATHERFRRLVLACKLAFRPLEGDPRTILRRKVGHDWLRSATPWGFSGRLAALMDPLLARAMRQCSAACRGAELVIHSLLGWMVAHSVAEELGIPTLAAYLQPATPTYAFPTLALGWRHGLGQAGNILTHRLSEQAFWTAVRGPINRARRSELGLPPLGRPAPFAAARRAGVPILYGFSSAVVPKPEDWREADHITGYWTLEPNADVDVLPRACVAIQRLLASGPAPVYIGFGSVGTSNTERTSRAILGALRDVGLRAVIALGWGGIVARSGTDVVVVRSIPHAWLFPRVAAVIHHGGAGTTAAGLLAGKPTLTIPQSAEQRFWGERVHALGVGPAPLPAGRLTRRRLADALARLSTDQTYVQTGRSLAEQLGRESGPNAAVALTERFLREGQIFPPARSVA